MKSSVTITGEPKQPISMNLIPDGALAVVVVDGGSTSVEAGEVIRHFPGSGFGTVGGQSRFWTENFQPNIRVRVLSPGEVVHINIEAE
jgi:hypothetical protein